MSRAFLAAAAVVVLAAAAPAAAPAKTTWLCTPQQTNDPCDYGLTATVVKPDGTQVGTQKAKPARNPKVDCFYVYPTVSDQKTPNATLAKDPEIRAIATYQASRFRQDCRVWAPMYKQVTLVGILGGSVPANASAIAYTSAKAAFDDYIKHDNHGRGFVLIGHSQGSFVLKQLIADEIDNKPALRKRMVSALLLGGNVTSKAYKHVSACSKAGQTGCVVAWSMFHDPPPADALFGRTTLKGQHVVCTSPSKLGSSSKLLPYAPTLPFPGTIGAALSVFEPNQPTGISKPWYFEPGVLTGSCATTADGASYLKIDGSVLPNPTPTPGWGLHLGDMNLAMGNLTTIAQKQISAYLKRS